MNWSSRLTSIAVLLLMFSSFSTFKIMAAETEDGVQESEAGWPREIQRDGQTITIYQPQVEKWKDNKLEQRAAVSVQTPGTSEPLFGVMWITARTEVDKENHMVSLEDIQITKANFPSAPEKSDSLLILLREKAPETLKPVSLDRLQASLSITRAESKGEEPALKNDAPKIFYSSTPATLILIDGKPALRGTDEKGLMRVINTRALMVLNKDNGKYYLFIDRHWVTAPSETGPWNNEEIPQGLKKSLNRVKKTVNEEKLVDLPDDDKSPEKNSRIFVSTVPAELLQTDGKPELEPVSDTQLLYVKNTDNNIFLNTTDQQYYVTLSGRWYRSPKLEGEWSYVRSTDLSPDFAKIPENHPKGDVLASVAGTPEAKDALISNQIPQTATVDRKEAKIKIVYDGAPEFQPIEGTSLQYAPNASVAVIQYRPKSFYAVQNGIWFTAPSPTGAWVVATEVPSAIYTIPPRSPMHYVTYVYVYGYSPQVVYVGYLPGYFGSYISSDGVVVYGTGYYYHPWVGTYWYGYPWSFGFGVSWNAAWGWGFHGGPFYHPWWGPWRGYNWGAWHGGFVSASFNHANFYNSWNHNAVRNTAVHIERPSAMAVHSSRNLHNNVYSDHKGNIYRHSENKGWEKYDAHNWKSAEEPAEKNKTQEVEHERTARAQGEKHAALYRQTARSGAQFKGNQKHR